jgi:multimeric flavodoxin WrbA
MRPLLAIVWHSRTGAALSLARAALAGAQGEEGVEARMAAAARADVSLLASAAAYLFVAPENLGSLSGAMKEMFDRTYYPLLGRIEGRPYATIIAAGPVDTPGRAPAV